MNASKKRKVSHKAPAQDKRPRRDSDSESPSTTARESSPEQNVGADETNEDAPKTFRDLV